MISLESWFLHTVPITGKWFHRPEKFLGLLKNGLVASVGVLAGNCMLAIFKTLPCRESFVLMLYRATAPSIFESTGMVSFPFYNSLLSFISTTIKHKFYMEVSSNGNEFSKAPQHHSRRKPTNAKTTLYTTTTTT